MPELSIGSGIKRMRDAMQEYGCPDLEIDITDSWFAITFSRSDSGPDSGSDSGPNSGPLSIRERIIQALAREPLSRSQLAHALGHKGISGRLKLRIKELMEEGLVEYTIPDNPTSRLQKYRLTEKGKAAIS